MNPEQIKIFKEAYKKENEYLINNQLSGKELVRWKYQRYLKDYLSCVKSVDDCAVSYTHLTLPTNCRV